MDNIVTAEQLGKIPLRGAVALAARAALRTWRYISTDNWDLAVTDLAMEFVCDPAIDPVRFRQVWKVGKALIKGPPKTVEARYTAYNAGLAVYYAAKALAAPDRGNFHLAAEMCISHTILAIRFSDTRDRDAVVADYETILQLCGKVDEVVLGHPFDPFDSGPLGPIVRVNH